MYNSMMEPGYKIHPIKKLKEKGKAESAKIKKIVIRRKDDMITALEKNWRDWALRPLTNLFRALGVSANQITCSGFILIAIAIWMYFTGYDFLYQFIILILAALSDGIDGPTARNNDNVTVLGTWLDHIRDACLVAWTSYLIYRFGLLNLQIILIVWALELLLAWISIKDFLVRYLTGLSAEEENTLLHQFSLDNLQASVIGRLQFFCWTVSYGFLLLYLFIPNAVFLSIGQSLIILEIIFAALNISDAYQKSLE